MRVANEPIPAAPSEGAGLPRRIRAPRAVGFAVGAIGVGAALIQHGGPHWLYVLMALHVFAWPNIAYAISSKSSTPKEAEYRNLVLDCLLSAFWVPAIGFNVLPSVLILAMVSMDVVAVGGRALLLRGLLAEVVGVLIGIGVVGVHLELASTLTITIACLPVLITYPLVVGLVMYRLSTRLSERRRQMAASERLYRDTLDAMQAGIVLYDAHDRLVLCNDTFRALHRPIDELLRPGQALEAVLRGAVAHGLVREARGREEAWIRGQLDRTRRMEPENREASGNTWRSVLDRRLPDGSLLSFSTDVTDLVRREQELKRLNGERDEYARQLREVNVRLEQLSHTDALTGVANRRLFDQRMQEEWLRGRRHGWWVSLVMLDVDYFKRFNDHHGHLAGDACLRRVAQALQGCARRASDLVARYGGEEFVLLLPHTSLADAEVVANRCLGAIDDALIAHGDSPLGPHVTVSIGMAAIHLCCESTSHVSLLVLAADRALYRAKENGRHRVERAEEVALDCDQAG